MGLFLLAFLVAWFLVYRAGTDFWTVASRGLAWVADRTADASDRLAARAPSAAAATRRRAEAAAAALRNRPSPAEPRTAAGQALLGGAGGVAAAGATALFAWLRLAVADARAAAAAARRRRAARIPEPEQETGGRRWRWRWPDWGRWPTGDDPAAPVQAISERLDRTPPEPEPAEPFELEPTPEPQPVLIGPQPAAVTTGGTTMTTAISPATTSGATAGEGGLGSYLDFARGMVAGCEQGVSITEATVGDMEGNGWGGPRTEHLKAGMDLMAQALVAFTAGVDALEGSVNVAESYAANEGTGERESVTAL